MDSVIKRVFAAASLSWLGLLVLATRVASRSHAGSTATLLSAATYAVGSLICHQRPERSFHFWGSQFPVCARCAGLYAGAALAAVAAATMQRSIGIERVLLHARAVLFIAALPTVLTLGYEWTTGDMPSNALRFAAGLPLGAAVLWLVVTVSTSRRAVAIH